MNSSSIEDIQKFAVNLSLWSIIMVTKEPQQGD
jgi:hypothetical protein